MNFCRCLEVQTPYNYLGPACSWKSSRSATPGISRTSWCADVNGNNGHATGGRKGRPFSFQRPSAAAISAARAC